MPVNVPKSRNGGKRLTDLQKEIVFQTYAISGSITETARATGVAYNTAYNILKKKSKEEVVEARKEMAVELASRVHDKTVEILDSMHPEDFETERYVDKMGVVREIGPSVLQKATAIGILVDKQTILLQLERNLAPAGNEANILIPSDMVTLLSGVNQRVKSLTAMGIKIELEPSQINTLEAAVVEAVRAEAGGTGEGEGFDFDG